MKELVFQTTPKRSRTIQKNQHSIYLTNISGAAQQAGTNK